MASLFEYSEIFFYIDFDIHIIYNYKKSLPVKGVEMGKTSATKSYYILIFLLIISLLFMTSIGESAISKLRVKGEKAPIRLKPTTESMVISHAPIGAILESEEKIGEWYKINLPPDEKGIVISGYIHQSIVEIIEEFKEVPKEKKLEEKKPQEITPPVTKEPEPREKKPSRTKPQYLPREIKAYQKKVTIKFGGGIGSSIGSWSDYYNIGFGGNGSIIYPIYPQIDLIGGLEFFYFGGESAKYSYAGVTAKADLSYTRIILSGDGRYSFKGKAPVFIEGGLGIYFNNEKVKGEYEIYSYFYSVTETFSISDSKTNLGVRLGGGIEFSSIEVIGMFHIVESNILTFMVSYRF